ncbi:beta-1,3-galactosyltransferase brn-like [Pecten maximus]|uniref:beta-1,3-galactosyltransferase brn-like n=1 Tax=Pecten maximus TaxID=6579 RepID=UPI0014583A8F|nr:beta-1,3-galactosyltransferase brn-like [Pecten maximus]
MVFCIKRYRRTSKYFIVLTSFCVLLFIMDRYFSNNEVQEVFISKYDQVDRFHTVSPSADDGPKPRKRSSLNNQVSIDVKFHQTDSSNNAQKITDKIIPISANATNPITSNKTSEETSPPKILPFSKFRYPLDIDFRKLVDGVLKTGTTDIKPINVYPYSFSEPMDNLCDSTSDIILLFMIKSAPGNFDQRQVIRETWTNNTYFQKDVIRHAFLLARTMNETVNNRLLLEKRLNHDIVEMSYVDDYYNNTYKTIGGINWCVKYCPTAKFVMLVDDDMYVATDFLLDYLHGLPQNMSDSLFVGRVWNDVPQRGPTQKWFMPIEDYPYKMYPPFLSAGAIIMSMDFVKRLQIAIQYTKKFKFDDVFLAIVAYKLGVKPIHHQDIHIHPVSYRDKKFITTLASHGYGHPDELKIAWYFHYKRLKFSNAKMARLQ